MEKKLNISILLLAVILLVFLFISYQQFKILKQTQFSYLRQPDGLVWRIENDSGFACITNQNPRV